LVIKKTGSPVPRQAAVIGASVFPDFAGIKTSIANLSVKLRLKINRLGQQSKPWLARMTRHWGEAMPR